MITLNLEANGEAQIQIKDYLENNVSDVLAEKINNGTRIVKDDKELINKKDLSGFMTYATSEARKLAEKQNYACVEDSVVYGWAIHYFEEDSIEGILFNLDGTEYKKIIPKTSSPAPTVIPPKPKKDDSQMSLFDMFDMQITNKTEEPVEEEIEPEDDSDQDIEIEQEDTDIDDAPTLELVDTDTGEIKEITNESEFITKLKELFDSHLEVRI